MAITERPKIMAFFIPCALVWLSLRKKVTVIGTIGNTQGVISEANPARKAISNSPPKESVPYEASPSRIEVSSTGPVFLPPVCGCGIVTDALSADGDSVTTADSSSGVISRDSDFAGSSSNGGDGAPETFKLKLKSSSNNTHTPSASEHTWPSKAPDTVAASSDSILIVCLNIPVF